MSNCYIMTKDIQEYMDKCRAIDTAKNAYRSYGKQVLINILTNLKEDQRRIIGSDDMDEKARYAVACHKVVRCLWYKHGFRWIDGEY